MCTSATSWENVCGTQRAHCSQCMWYISIRAQLYRPPMLRRVQMINRPFKFKLPEGKTFLWCIRTHLETILHALKTHCFEAQKGNPHYCLFPGNRRRHPRNTLWVTNTLHRLTSDITHTLRRQNISVVCCLRRVL